MFRKILIANRGEIARRLIRSVHSVGAKAVVVYSEADAKMPYLNEADEKVLIGKAPAEKSYLNQQAILQAAIDTECAALHPGFGFLAENALFAARCEQQKLTFIGPRPQQIRQMGDKAEARRQMKAAGLAITLGSQNTIDCFQNAQKAAQEIGYPLLLKASAGGGGKGMRLVNNPKEMEKAFSQASAEATKSFGDGRLYLEKFLQGARHIEWQILADRYGSVVVLGERECSIQRNHQKLLEESPAHGMSEELRQKTMTLVQKALQKIGYQGAGTLEFLLDKEGKMYFMEMNTRLQVEHPVTELVSGVDIVSWQIRIAAGEKLAPELFNIKAQGHAIECRINAEDPWNNFCPSPGSIEYFSAPKNHWQGPLRIDTHVETGVSISPFYDSMIAKVIAWGKTRAEALKLMQDSLEELKIDGIATTLPLHQKILHNKTFIEGAYTCNFMIEEAVHLKNEETWQK